MKVIIAIIAGVALLGVVAWQLNSGGAQSDEAAIESLLRNEMDYVRSRDSKRLYALLSPSAREECSLDEIQQALNLVPVNLLKDLTIGNVEVTVSGDRASASYVVIANGDSSIEHDTFVKVGGRWYDDAGDEDRNIC